MSAGAIELLDVVTRWIHVIAGIMWVGNSLLFNWLDRNLQHPASANSTGDSGKIGDIWLLHSGAFYYVEKTLLGTRSIPAPLHWFKWQAYSTWISGTALLVVVYYAGGRAVLTGGALIQLSHRDAVCVGVAAIVLGWALYEGAQRFIAPRAPAVANAIWMVGLTAIAVVLTQWLNGRAAFLHVGAMLGTIMAANVFFTIVPSQRELVASVIEGRGASPVVSARAKRVSIHNNYFTFPVIVLMVSGHFPVFYGSALNWALLLLLVISGAVVRHVLNIRNEFPQWQPALAGVMVAGLLALYAIQRAGRATDTSLAAAASNVGPFTFSDVRHVIDRRCSVCHSALPSDLSFGVAPGGAVFDTPEQIAVMASRIRERTVVTRTMPPGNKTNMTEAERVLLGRWVSAGASVR